MIQNDSIVITRSVLRQQANQSGSGIKGSSLYIPLGGMTSPAHLATVLHVDYVVPCMLEGLSTSSIVMASNIRLLLMAHTTSTATQAEHIRMHCKPNIVPTAATSLPTNTQAPPPWGHQFGSLQESMVYSLSGMPSVDNCLQALVGQVLAVPSTPTSIQSIPQLLDVAICSHYRQPSSAADPQLAATALLQVIDADFTGMAVKSTVELLMSKHGQSLVFHTILHQTMKSNSANTPPPAVIDIVSAAASWCRPSYTKLSPALRVELLKAIAHNTHLLVQGLKHPNRATRLLACQLLAHTSETPTGQLAQKGQLMDILAVLAEQQDNTLASFIILAVRNTLVAQGAWLDLPSSEAYRHPGWSKLLVAVLRDGNIHAAAAVYSLAQTPTGQRVLAPYVVELLKSAAHHTNLDIAMCAAATVSLLAAGVHQGRNTVLSNLDKLLAVIQQQTCSTVTARGAVIPTICQALLALVNLPTSPTSAYESTDTVTAAAAQQLSAPSNIGILLHMSLQMVSSSYHPEAQAHSASNWWPKPWLNHMKLAASSSATIVMQALGLVARINMQLPDILLQQPDLLHGLLQVAVGGDSSAAVAANDVVYAMLKYSNSKARLLAVLAQQQQLSTVLHGLEQGRSGPAGLLQVLAKHTEFHVYLLPYLATFIPFLAHPDTSRAAAIWDVMKHLCERPSTMEALSQLPSAVLLPMVRGMPGLSDNINSTAAVAAAAVAAVASLASTAAGQLVLVPHLALILGSLAAHKLEPFEAGTASSVTAAACAVTCSSKEALSLVLELYRHALDVLNNDQALHPEAPSGGSQPDAPLPQPEQGSGNAEEVLNAGGQKQQQQAAIEATSIGVPDLEQASDITTSSNEQALGNNTEFADSPSSTDNSNHRLSVMDVGEQQDKAVYCNAQQAFAFVQAVNEVLLSLTQQESTNTWLGDLACIQTLVQAICLSSSSSTSSSKVATAAESTTSESARCVGPGAASGAGAVLVQLLSSQHPSRIETAALLGEHHMDGLVTAMQRGSLEAAQVVAAAAPVAVVKERLVAHDIALQLLGLLASDVSLKMLESTAMILVHTTYNTVPKAPGEGQQLVCVPHPAGVEVLATLDLSPVVQAVLKCASYSRNCALALLYLSLTEVGKSALVAHVSQLTKAPAALQAKMSYEAAKFILRVLTEVASCPAGQSAVLSCIDSIIETIHSTNQAYATAGLGVLKAVTQLKTLDYTLAAQLLADDKQIQLLFSILEQQEEQVKDKPDGADSEEEDIVAVEYKPQWPAAALEAAASLLFAVSRILNFRHKVLARAATLIQHVKRGLTNNMTAVALRGIASALLDLTLSTGATYAAPIVSLAAEYDARSARVTLAQLDVRALIEAASQQQVYSDACAAAVHNVCLVPEGVAAVLPYIEGLTHALQAGHDGYIADTLMEALQIVSDEGAASRLAVAQHLAVLIQTTQERKGCRFGDAVCRTVLALVRDADTRPYVVAQPVLSVLLPILVNQVTTNSISIAAQCLSTLASTASEESRQIVQHVAQLLAAIQPVQQQQHQQQEAIGVMMFSNEVLAYHVISMTRKLLNTWPEDINGLAEHMSSILAMLQCQVTAESAAVFTAQHGLPHPSVAAYRLVELIINSTAGARALMKPQHVGALVDRLLEPVQQQSAAAPEALVLMSTAATHTNGRKQLSKPQSMKVLLAAVAADQDDPLIQQTAVDVAEVLLEMAQAAAAAGEAPGYIPQMAAAIKQKPVVADDVLKCLAVMTTYRAGQLQLAKHIEAVSLLGSIDGLTADTKEAIADIQQVVQVVVSELNESLLQSELVMAQKAVQLAMQYKVYSSARSVARRAKAAAALMQQMTLFAGSQAVYAKLKEQQEAAQASQCSV